MKYYLSVIFCVLLVFSALNKVTAKVPPCSGPAAISGIDTVCQGATIILSDTTAGGAWSSSNTAIAIIGSSTGIVTGISGGAVTITYTLSSGCFVTKLIDVKPMPPINGNTAVCVGASVLFTDLTSGGVWNSSNTSVATINASTGAAIGNASGITIISYTISNGCTAQTLLTVNPLPPNYYVLGGGYYCEGTSGATIGLNGSDSGINYLLYNGSTLVDSMYGTGSAIYSGPYTAAGTYQIYGVNIATRCTNRMSGIATIGITPLNIPSVSISTPVGDTVCILASTTFTAIPVNPGPYPFYQWFVNGSSVGTGSTYSYVPNNGDVVSVIITSDAVCAIPNTATGTMTMTTIPKVIPSLSISVVPGDTVCAHIPVTIIPAPVYGGPAPVYRWIKNGISMGTGSVYHYMPANGDNILCSMHSNYECLITDSAYSINNINMSVIPVLVPTVSIAAYPGDTIHIGHSDTLVATVLNGGTAPTYQWKINNITIPGATIDTFISSSFATNDTVSCVVVTNNLCSEAMGSDYIVITDTGSVLGMQQITNCYREINIAPNPNAGVFTINGTSATSEYVVIGITDLLGQTVYQQHIPIPKGVWKIPVDLTNKLSDGVYVIHIVSTSGSAVQRFTLYR